MRSNLLRDPVKVRPFAGFKFGVNEFTIDANFKGTAAGRDQPRLHARGFLNESGQPGRFRFVVSVGAVLDRYFWLHARLLCLLNAIRRESSVELAPLRLKGFQLRKFANAGVQSDSPRWVQRPPKNHA